MTDYIVSSGVTSSGITLTAFDTMSVLAGGSAISTTDNGTYLTVYSGGTTTDTTVNASGYEYVSGIVTDTTVNSGGTEYVLKFNGASANSTTVSAGGVQNVYGTASGTTVDVSGLQIVEIGGSTLSTTINNGGVANVSGITDATTLSSGAAEVVFSGGTASGTILDSGAQLILTPGATALGTIQSGGLVTTSGVALAGGDSGTTFYGSAASGVVVGGGQELFVLPGGSASALTVDSGAVTVDSGTTTGTRVSGSFSTPGYEYVSRGGTVSGTFLYSGAFAYIDAGATAIDTTVSGGYQIVYGVAVSTTVSGGTLFVESGSVSNTTVTQGELEVYGGTADNTILNDNPPSPPISGAGGYGGYDGVEVYNDGEVSGTTVNGGLLGLGGQFSEGVAVSTTVNSGGYEVISAYGYATDTLLNLGGAIDVTTLSYTSGGTVTLSPSDLLTVSMGGQTYSQQLSGNYTGEYFHLSDASSLDLIDIGGTLITLNDTPCYCRGTRILTDSGERAVEQLSIGDKVVTKSGEARSLRWIGRRSYSGPYAASHPEVLPVLIKQGALADELPRRDLWVSPLHAMFLDGMLVPAAALVNGISIVRAEAVEQLDYFHLELDTHDVIYAEGAMAESFVDDDSRGMFHNAAHYQRLYPQALHEPARYCAPRVEEGMQLEALRPRLLERAQPRDSRAVPGRLLGHVDAVSRERIEGWAQDEAAPNAPVSLRVLDNDIVIGQVLADRYREDLQQVGIGDGRHGFSLIVSGGLSPLVPHVIQIQRVCDGQQLRDSPNILQPA